MTDRRLYAVALPEGTQTDQTGRAEQKQSLQALLEGDTGTVEQLGADPEEQPLTVEFADELAERRAAEVRELAQGLSQPLPYYSTDARTPADGYWSVSGVDRAAPIDPRIPQVQRARVTLRQEGAPASHYRRVRVAPSSVSHPFGSDSTAEFGIPSLASNIRWYDPETETTARPSLIQIRTSNKGNVSIYNADAAPSEPAELIYELDFDEEGKTDPRIFDTFDEDNRFEGGDPSNALQWQKVFAPGHEFAGNVFITNGLIRLFIVESTPPGLFKIEKYTSGSWSSVTLSFPSGVDLLNWEIRSIGTSTIGGIAEFTDGTEIDALRWSLTRGGRNFVFVPVDTLTIIGLQTALDPIAADHDLLPFGSLQATPSGLRPRREVV